MDHHCPVLRRENDEAEDLTLIVWGFFFVGDAAVISYEVYLVETQQTISLEIVYHPRCNPHQVEHLPSYPITASSPHRKS